MMNRINLLSAISLAFVLAAGFLSSGSAGHPQKRHLAASTAPALIAHAAPEGHDHDEQNGEKASRKQRG